MVFDTNVPSKDAFGVYGLGKALELSNPKEVYGALVHTYGRGGNKLPNSDEFLGDSPLRAYKLEVAKMWMNDAEHKNGIYIDYRVSLSKEELLTKLF